MDNLDYALNDVEKLEKRLRLCMANLRCRCANDIDVLEDLLILENLTRYSIDSYKFYYLNTLQYKKLYDRARGRKVTF